MQLFVKKCVDESEAARFFFFFFLQVLRNALNRKQPKFYGKQMGLFLEGEI